MLTIRIPDFVAIAKARSGNVLSPRTFDRIVLGLGREMKVAALAGEKKAVAAATQIIDRDWLKLTTAQQGKLLDRIGVVVTKHHAEVARKVLPSLKRYGRRIAAGARRAVREQWAPEVGLSLNSQDVRYVNHAATTNSWFIRDYGGKINRTYRGAAQAIITEGAESGFDPEQIAKKMKERFRGSVMDNSRSYYETVAYAALGRARNWGQLSSFDEAGIRRYRFAAVLDDLTTDICFAAGTMVVTGKGEMSIEDVRPGIRVLTRSGFFMKVTGTSHRNASSWVRLVFGHNRTLTVTPLHRLLSVDGWERSMDAFPGQRYVLGANERLSTAAVISKEQLTTTPMPAFNLEVGTDPTYVAEGVVVHNCRFMDGKEFDVATGIAKMQSAEAAATKNPEAIKEEAPWVTTITRDEKQYLAYKKGGERQLVAEILETGVGDRDKIGTYKTIASNDKLKDDGVAQPPLHGRCRSLIEPVF